MRLIDADALMARLEERKDPFVSIGYLSGLCKAQEYIDDAPTVEPKRKTGKWIHEGWEASYLRCSACGYRDYTEEHNNFCPNCGADMRGDLDE